MSHDTFKLLMTQSTRPRETRIEVEKLWTNVNPQMIHEATEKCVCLFSISSLEFPHLLINKTRAVNRFGIRKIFLSHFWLQVKVKASNHVRHRATRDFMCRHRFISGKSITSTHRCMTTLEASPFATRFERENCTMATAPVTCFHVARLDYTTLQPLSRWLWKSTQKSFIAIRRVAQHFILYLFKLQLKAGGRMDWKQILSLSNEDLNDERKEEIYTELIKDQKFDGKIAKKLFPWVILLFVLRLFSPATCFPFSRTFTPACAWRCWNTKAIRWRSNARKLRCWVSEFHGKTFPRRD